MIAQRLIPMVTALLGYVLLLAFHLFTPASAAAVVLPLMFGSAFNDVVPMLLILLAASIPSPA